MTDTPPPPIAPPPEAPKPSAPAAPWARRVAWHRAGYILSALWVGGILVATDGNVRHPLFNYIFIVPLVGWAVGALIGRFFGRRDRTPPRV